MRTDDNNNPAAFTTAIAAEAGLELGTDYAVGTPFQANGQTYYTARLLGDPVALTIKVIDAIGYRTRYGTPRWTYICLPEFVWQAANKVDVIGYHYQNEGGVAMRHLFPHYGLR